MGCALFFLFSGSSNAEISIPEVDHLIERGSYELAYSRMLELKNKKPSSKLLFKIAQTLEKLQDYPSAMIHYQELIQTYPGSLYEGKSREKLVAYFGMYRESDVYTFNTKIETHMYKGVDKLKEKDFHQAIIHLRQALNQRGGHYLINFYLGFAYFELFQTNPKMADYLNQAIRFYLNAISSRQSPKAYNNLACIFAGEQDEVLAHVYFRRALETASSPIRLEGLIKVIQENLDYFSSERKTRDLQVLRELMQ